MLSYAYIIGTFPLSVHGAPPLQLGSIYGRVVQGLIFPVSCLLTLALFQSWAVSAAVTVSLVQANSLGTYKWDGKRGAAGGIVALQHTYICNFDEICQIHFHWRLSLWTPYGNFGVLAFPALPTPCYNYFLVVLEVGRAYCCGVPLNEVEHFSHLWAICVSSFVNSFDLPPTFLLHSWSFHLPLDDFQSPLHPNISLELLLLRPQFASLQPKSQLLILVLCDLSAPLDTADGLPWFSPSQVPVSSLVFLLTSRNSFLMFLDGSTLFPQPLNTTMSLSVSCAMDLHPDPWLYKQPACGRLPDFYIQARSPLWILESWHSNLYSGLH